MNYTQLAMRLKFKDKKSMKQQSQLKKLNNDEKK